MNDNATEPLRFLAYTSVAVGTPDDAIMEEILEVARAHNSSVDITGFLSYRNFRFIQFLEGPPEAIGALMESISADPRHTAVKVVIDEDAPARSFPHWSMAFHVPDAATPNPFADLDTTPPQEVVSESIREFSRWVTLPDNSDSIRV